MSLDKKYLVYGYYPTIGIECHVQLKTETKLFAAVGNDARAAEPNTLISHICLGLPGALPVLNEKAVELALKAAFALSVNPQKFSKFDRKHYFYPDLPMGYQITQFDQPIIIGGYVEAMLNGEPKRFAITRAHIEADAGKSIHPAGASHSLVDLNRAGTPLLEIVSEPCMHSAEEAKAYARELYLLMKYADVSYVNLFYGNMRFDVNVSISKDENVLGTRTETKNLNSFKSIASAIDYEIKRQIEILKQGGEIVQETRGWDDDNQTTFSQRNKEDAHDYRYFPDPDIPPIILAKDYVTKIKSTMTMMPTELRKKFSDMNLDNSQTETILDEPIAAYIVSDFISRFGLKQAKIVANWLSGIVQKNIADNMYSWEHVKKAEDRLEALVLMQTSSELSSTAAKDVLTDVLLNNSYPKEVASKKNLIQVSDTATLDKIVANVLAENPKAASDVANGELKAIGFLVGQVMKASRGSANPEVVQISIKKQLGV